MGVELLEMASIARELPKTAGAEIRSSWERCWSSGVRPDLSLDRLETAEVDQDSRFMRAALPVLDRVADELAETSFFTVLADCAARIVDRGRISHRIEEVLDSTGVVLGRRFTEDSTGTNGIATPFELRRGLAVSGGEHFAQSLRCYSCYGYPIINPVTRRLEGVLTLAGPAGEENPLFGPFLRSAAAEIEQALLANSRDTERRLLAAFDAAVARRDGRAVVALGDTGVVLANQVALDHFDSADHGRLRELAAGLRWGGGGRAVDFETTSGLRLRMQLEVVDGYGNVLIRFVPAYRSRPAPVRGPSLLGGARESTERELVRCSTHRLATVVAGEPGTGRTSIALRLAESTDAAVVALSGVDVDFQGRVGWLDRLRRAGDSGALVIVDGFELLDDRLSRAVGESIASGAWIVLIGPPVEQLEPEHRHLAFRCPGRIELMPLHARRAEIPALAQAILAEETGGLARFTPEALARLAELDWPGNVRELDHVVRRCAAHRSAGDVLISDLPPEYRSGPERTRMSPWERADHDVIVAALERNGGNKVRAAKDLGISRGTLYNRIRTLRIKV